MKTPTVRGCQHNGDAETQWEPPMPLAPRKRPGRAPGHLQVPPPRCRVATADNPATLGTLLAATQPTLGSNRTRAAKAVTPDRDRRTPINNHHGTPRERAVDSLADPPTSNDTHNRKMQISSIACRPFVLVTLMRDANVFAR